MTPEAQYLHNEINDIRARQETLLRELDAAQREMQEATANVKALEAALKDLEADAAVEALEDPEATNDAKRKVAAHKLLKKSAPYASYKDQLADALRKQREAQADFDDLERRHKSAEKALHPLAAQILHHAESVKAEGDAHFLAGCIRYLSAAEKNLAARGGAR